MPLISIHMYYENDLLNLVKFPGCTQPPTWKTKNEKLKCSPGPRFWGTVSPWFGRCPYANIFSRWRLSLRSTTMIIMIRMMMTRMVVRPNGAKSPQQRALNPFYLTHYAIGHHYHHCHRLNHQSSRWSGPEKINTHIKVSLVQSILIQQLLFSLFSLTERPKSCYRRNDNNYFGTEPSSLQKICQEGGWS